MKCMKTEVFYGKSDMHVRPIRFSILCTPIDSSDKNPIDVFYYVAVLVTSKYDLNGSRLYYSSVSSNKFMCIHM